MNNMVKKPHAQQLRNVILEQVPNAIETDRAEASTIELSFVSRTLSNRHAWINTEWPTDQGTMLRIELEDWTVDSSWDNTIYHVESTSPELIVEAIRKWFSGEDTELSTGQ